MPALIARPGASQRASGLGNLPMIRFSPDGFIAETSPEHVVLRQGEVDAIWIVQSPNRLNYEIQSEEPQRALR
jgi:hypothetical protein